MSLGEGTAIVMGIYPQELLNGRKLEKGLPVKVPVRESGYKYTFHGTSCQELDKQISVKKKR
jgi:hypothetical protein